MILVFMSMTHAGSVNYLNNFTNQSYQTADLSPGDSLLFNYKDGRHAIIFNKFEVNNSVSMTIFVFQTNYGEIPRNQSAMFVTLKTGIKVGLDLDRDNIQDVDIRYLRQIFGKATIQIVPLNLSDANIIHNQVIDNNQNINETNISINGPIEQQKSNAAIGVSIIIGIIIIGVLIYWLVTRKKSTDKTPESKKEENK
jgi:hypothetical protein